MLMGAVANMAPDLFLGIIADVPFVDVLEHDAGQGPAADPAGVAGMGQSASPARRSSRSSARYSPYDNVEAKDYPHILRLAGLTDPRVTYWEPAKWIARLRAAQHQRQHGPSEDQHGAPATAAPPAASTA